ncbi:hypothetical protein P3370_23870, partial [Vibrio parahaemolyticus]|nr:hypothetical protein [Vibrio parahaemolyticus]
ILNLNLNSNLKKKFGPSNVKIDIQLWRKKNPTTAAVLFASGCWHQTRISPRLSTSGSAPSCCLRHIWGSFSIMGNCLA